MFLLYFDFPTLTTSNCNIIPETTCIFFRNVQFYLSFNAFHKRHTMKINPKPVSSCMHCSLKIIIITSHPAPSLQRPTLCPSPLHTATSIFSYVEKKKKEQMVCRPNRCPNQCHYCHTFPQVQHLHLWGHGKVRPCSDTCI